MTHRRLPPAAAAALAAVGRDVDAHGVGLRLDTPVSPDDDAATWIWQDDGSGSGVYLDDGEEPDAAVAARVADAVHDAAIDALWGQGRDTAWPPCREHPGSHPLVIAQGTPDPLWACPTSGLAACAVGGLGR